MRPHFDLPGPFTETPTGNLECFCASLDAARVNVIDPPGFQASSILNPVPNLVPRGKGERVLRGRKPPADVSSPPIGSGQLGYRGQAKRRIY